MKKININMSKKLMLGFCSLLLFNLFINACGDLEEVTIAVTPLSQVRKSNITLAPTVTRAPTKTATISPTSIVAAQTVPPTVIVAAQIVTPTFSPTKVAVITPTVTAISKLPALKPSVVLEPMTWESQTFNNCAPMSALMSLSFYGLKLNQEQCRKIFRPNPTDRHVEPMEIVNFIQNQGFMAIIRENGSMDEIRALLSAGVPVITQQWLHDPDDIGHYRVARGYDLANDTLIFNDSMDKKPKTVVSVAPQDKIWKAYDRRYIPIYAAKQEATVMAILGQDADEASNLKRALTAAQAYAEAKPTDIDAWRNLGYLRYASGDCVGALKVWEEKLTKMLVPSENGPYNRFLWYQLWPVECYNKVGNYAQVLKIMPSEIAKTVCYAQARYQYAVALLNSKRREEAIIQLKKAILDDQNYKPSYDLLEELGV